MNRSLFHDDQYLLVCETIWTFIFCFFITFNTFFNHFKSLNLFFSLLEYFFHVAALFTSEPSEISTKLILHVF